MAVGKEVGWWEGFLNQGCGIEEIWKRGRKAWRGYLVSQSSHRGAEKGCGLEVDCVNCKLRSVWSKELEEALNPQLMDCSDSIGSGLKR